MLYTDEAIKNRQIKVNKVKKVISIIIYIFIAILLLYNVSLVVQSVTNPNKTPSFLGYKTYVITSGSMEPFLQIGDIVIVKQVEEQELQKDDIISFRRAQSVVTHRLIDITEEDGKKQFQTKGDNNNTEDSLKIDYESIEGKYVSKIPLLGKVTLALKGKLLIIVIAFMIYFYYIHSTKANTIRNRRKMKRLEYEREKNQEEEKH